MENYVKEIDKSRDITSAVNSVMYNIFLLMTLALAVTGGVSYYMVTNENMVMNIVNNISIFYMLAIAELVFVLVLSLFINELSASVAMILFGIYSVLNGITLAPIFLIYTQESIASAFFITAGTFGAMALFGYITKRNLSGIGRTLTMALMGIIIASIVNFFTKSSQMEMIINYVAVIVFVGLTAYDTQKIKKMVEENIGNNAFIPKLAVIGSLILYLDFINLFIRILRIIGKRK